MDPAPRSIERPRWLAAGLALLLPGCTLTEAGVPGLSSLRVTLKEPAEGALGTEDKPAQVAALRYDVAAIDDQGQVLRADLPVQAYLATGGGRLSLRSPCGGGGGAEVPWLLQRVQLKDGVALDQQVPLSGALASMLYGRFSLAVEDPVTGATGATPPIYLPNPTVRQLMEPLDLEARDASYCSRFLNRQATLRPSAGGKLVVSSLFTTGFTITDSGERDFSSMYVFTFSQPGKGVAPGKVITRISGIVGKFNGFTQLANSSFTVSPTDSVTLPDPPLLAAADRPKLVSAGQPVPEGNKALLRRIAAPVRVAAYLCDLSDSRRKDQYDRYATAVLTFDPDPMVMDKDACDSRKTFSVQLPRQGFGGLDPDALARAGQKVQVTGMLQNSAAVASGTLFWTLVVRDLKDVCLDPASGKC